MVYNVQLHQRYVGMAMRNGLTDGIQWLTTCMKIIQADHQGGGHVHYLVSLGLNTGGGVLHVAVDDLLPNVLGIHRAQIGNRQ